MWVQNPSHPFPNFQKHATDSRVSPRHRQHGVFGEIGYGKKISSPVHFSQIGRREKRGKEKGIKGNSRERRNASADSGSHGLLPFLRRAAPRTLSHSDPQQKREISPRNPAAIIQAPTLSFPVLYCQTFFYRLQALKDSFSLFSSSLSKISLIDNSSHSIFSYVHCTTAPMKPNQGNFTLQALLYKKASSSSGPGLGGPAPFFRQAISRMAKKRTREETLFFFFFSLF